MELNTIWNEIEETGENIDLLLILYKLSNLVGRNESIEGMQFKLYFIILIHYIITRFIILMLYSNVVSNYYC